MFDSQRGGRRPTYRYDKTDLILLGGGGLFVIVGAALAIGAWLDPSARTAGSLATMRTAKAGASADSTTPPPRPGLIAQHDSAAAAAKAAAPTVATAPTESATARPAVATPVVAAPAPVAAAKASPKPTAPAAAPATVAVPAPSTIAKPTTTAAPEVAGQFLVQLGSFGQQENADRLATRARSLGFTVSVVPAGALHRVLIGGFTTRADAATVRDSLARTLEITPKLLP